MTAWPAFKPERRCVLSLDNHPLKRKNSPADKLPPGSLFYLEGFAVSSNRAHAGQTADGSIPFQENVERALLAAACSASFLLCPEPEPMGVPFSSTSAEKIFAWSGPRSPDMR